MMTIQTNFPVSTEADPNNAIQAIDASGADAATNTAYTIDIAGPISLTSGLLVVNLDSGSSLTIAGSGAAGCEYASIFAALGTRVTIAVTCSRQSTRRWPGSSANASMPWGSA
jgi:pyruvate/2-oxoglutarate dehydrogenase complex dihydrolipoamide dehydrogenase (E3) component